jgi:CubicO group peptidase (beta-lactamase class C family)
MPERLAGFEIAASPAELGFDPDGIDRLSAYMADMVEAGRIAGGAFVLLRHGQVAVLDCVGEASLKTHRPIRPDTLYRIYSMTKPVTAVAMMQLHEQGRWALDDPVTRFLPKLSNLRVCTGVDAAGAMITEPASRPPTIREVMSHTAGFGYGLFDRHPVDRAVYGRAVLQAPDLPTMIDRLADIPLMFEPGTEWSYSVSSDVLGRLVEVISGQGLPDYFRDHIFAPLGMVDTGFHVPPEKLDRLADIYTAGPDGRLEEARTLFGFPIIDFTRPPTLPLGGGGLVSTAWDYARFCQMILNRGELDGVRLLKRETVDLLTTNQIPDAVLARPNPARLLPFGPAFGFTLGFSIMLDPAAVGAVEGRGTLAWGGGGGTWFWIDPQNDLIFVGLIQRMADPVSAEFRTVARQLTYDALIDRGAPKPRKSHDHPVP